MRTQRPLRDGARGPRRVRLPVPDPRWTPISNAASSTSSRTSPACTPPTGKVHVLRPGGDLDWIATAAPRASGDGGVGMVRMALDQLAERLPDGFVDVAETYMADRRPS